MKSLNAIWKAVKIFFDRRGLALILILGFALRSTGIPYGLPYIRLIPDEHSIINPLIRILTAGDWNPHWFGWPGTFITYLLAILSSMVFGALFVILKLSGLDTNWTECLALGKTHPALLHFMGRCLMIFFSVITLGVTYRLGKRLFGKSAGILAALLLALSPLHIKYSYHLRPDITASMLVLLSVYFLIRFIDHPQNTKMFVLSGLCAGFSIAAKYTAGAVIVPFLFHSIRRDAKINSGSQKTMSFFSSWTVRACLLIFAGFFIFCPYFFFEIPRVLSDLAYENRPQHLSHDRLPGLGNYAWYLKTVLSDGIGGPFFAAAALLGLVLATRRRQYRDFIFLLFPVLFFLALGTAQLRWTRWMIPILPFETILAGFGTMSLFERFNRPARTNKMRGALILIVALISSVFFIRLGIQAVGRAAKITAPDNRILADQWIKQHLPKGSALTYAPPIPSLSPPAWGSLKPINPHANEHMIDFPLDYFRARQIRYLAVNVNLRKRILAEPETYPKQIKAYDELARHARLIKIFDSGKNPGPVVEIYELREEPEGSGQMDPHGFKKDDTAFR